MEHPKLSIVIPTHKRAKLLQQCLEHIEKQTIAKQLELIVVSDGHDDETSDLMAHIAKTENSPNASLAGFQFIEIPKSQQGIARNRGVEKASAPIILFSQDDIFLAPDACEIHLRSHTENNSEFLILNSKFKAILGFTTWDPACGITPVMTWLEKTGWQFGYPMIAQYAHEVIPQDIQHKFTYTSHISLPTKIALAHPFREDVSLYGWEDILWGTELQKAGVSLVYEPNAKALHHHHLEMKDSLKRMETIGRSINTMKKIDPTFDRIPHGWKFAARRVIALFPTVRGKHEKAFLNGIQMA